jgi:hypothetical protein
VNIGGQDKTCAFQYCSGPAPEARLTVLEDVKGETVTMGFASLATDFDKFAPEAQKVIDGVEWTGS